MSMSHREIPLSGERGAGLCVIVSTRALSLVEGKKWYLAVNGYVVTSRGEYIHRTITAASQGMDVDHINFDKLDCRDENIRVVTKTENRRHNLARSNSSQPYKGVRMKKHGTCQARIRLAGKEYYLGTFSTAEDAAMAYDKAAISMFGEMAHLNFPERIQK